MFQRFKYIIVIGPLVGLMLFASCIGQHVSGSGSDTAISDSSQSIERGIDIDSIIKSVKDSLRVEIPRRIKKIEPEIPSFNVFNTDVEGDFADPTTTYHFKFENSLSESFLNHLKNPSSGWVRKKNNRQTIYEKENVKMIPYDEGVDYIERLVIIPSKNSGYFRIIDF